MVDGPLEQVVHIDAPPATVWDLWVDPEGLQAWWGKARELDPQPGGAYVVEISHHAHAGGWQFFLGRLAEAAIGRSLN